MFGAEIAFNLGEGGATPTIFGAEFNFNRNKGAKTPTRQAQITVVATYLD